MTKNDIIENTLSGCSDAELVSLWNEYCDSNNDADSCLYNMDDFDSLYEGCTPTEIAEAIIGGDFRSGDDYFTFNGYGHIQTTSNPQEFMDMNELVNYVIEHSSDGIVFDEDEFKEGFIEEFNIDDEDSLEDFLSDTYVSFDVDQWISYDWDGLYEEYESYLEDKNDDTEYDEDEEDIY